MSTTRSPRRGWFKSSRSNGQNACVEVNLDEAEVVGVRDSKDRSGPVLSVAGAGWREFVAAAKGGEFDLPA